MAIWFTLCILLYALLHVIAYIRVDTKIDCLVKKGEFTMGIIEDATAKIDALTDTLHLIDNKLDDVRTKIDALETGTVITQEQKDALNASLTAAQDEANLVLDETTTLATPDVTP